MTQRIQLSQRSSEPYQQLLRLHSLVEKAAAGAGLDQRLIELVKIRGSMLNGCSFCLDLHTRTARRSRVTCALGLPVSRTSRTAPYLKS